MKTPDKPATDVSITAELERLRAELGVGEADLKAGRVTTFLTDEELDDFFASMSGQALPPPASTS